MNVGFIGLGKMGGPIALRLLRAGHRLTVLDERREAAAPHLAAGATWADTPAAVASAATVVLTSLPGPKEVEVVTLGQGGLAAGLAPGAAFFDLSTNAPAVVRRLHDVLARQGVAMLDAPVSGGPRGAQTGELALWVGGDEAVFEGHRALLLDVGDQPRYIGPIGAGSIAKLVHNCAVYTVQTALAEVFTLGVKAGLEPLALFEAVRQGALGRRRTFEGLPEQFLAGSFDTPTFPLRLAHKDMTLATDLARDQGVPMRLADLVMNELTEALNRGWGERDYRAAMLLQEERAGVEIKVEPERLKALDL